MRPRDVSGRARRQPTLERREEIFNDAVEIIDREYADDLDVDALARRVAASRRQLQRSFAEVGGTTIRDYVTMTRMAHAAARLEDGGTSVKRVALSVGYRQPAHFAKAFRRHYGTSPSAFRARSAAAGQPGGRR